MKTTILKSLLSLICFLFVFTLIAQEPYSCVVKGAKLEYTKTGPDGKIEGYRQEEILDVQRNVENGDTLGTIIKASILLNKNRKPETDEAIKMIVTFCNGTISVDLAENIASTITAVLGKQMGVRKMDEEKIEEINKLINLRVSGEPSILPGDIKPGDMLVDAFAHVMLLEMIVKMSLTGRKALRLEDITTSTGTYSCIVVQENMEGNSMGVEKDATIISWCSRGMGVIRQEVYGKEGKLESVEVLSSLVM